MRNFFTLIISGLVFMQIHAQQITTGALAPTPGEQLPETSTEVLVRLYPNPSRDHIQLTFSDKMTGNTIRVYSLPGTEVAMRSITGVQEQIDLSSSQSGLYIYRITDRNNKTLLSGKFDKQ